MVVAWHLGKRTAEDTWRFAQKLKKATAGRFRLSSDGFSPYGSIMPQTFGERIDYMQVVKTYGFPGSDDNRRYSPPTVIGIKYEYLCGHPKLDRVCTSIVERGNLSVRMSVRRFTRLSNAFSKKWANHGHALALWFAYYNSCRKHSTIKQPPAMAIGVADHVWTIRELLEAAANV